MKPRSVFDYVVIVALIIVGIRFLPLVLRLFQALVMGVRAFWFVVLPLVALGWLCIKMKRRKSVLGKSQSPENQPMRDVTNSAFSEPKEDP